MISIAPAAVAHPEDRGISHVYGVQHSAGDGKDSSNNVHKHSEAHLRGETPLISIWLVLHLRRIILFTVQCIFPSISAWSLVHSTYQAGRRELSGQNGHDSSCNELMRGEQTPGISDNYHICLSVILPGIIIKHFLLSFTEIVWNSLQNW